MRSILLPLALLAELPTLRALRRPEHELASLARHRLRDVLDAAARTPWHAERLAAAGIEAWYTGRVDPYEVLRALPPVSKGDVTDAGNSAVLDGRVRRRWFHSRSSGSTGEPFRVWYDARAWAILKYLVKSRARFACGVSPVHRIALLDAIELAHEGKALLERAGRLRRISVLQPAERVADKIAAYRPHAMYALPSAAVDAGHALGPRAAQLGLGAIFTSGELLTGATRLQLERIYQAPVRDIYGTSETKEIAWECHAGKAHINMDVVHLEVLGDDDAPAADGEEGAIAATLLVNRAMPLLRYRTGDRGSISRRRCDCGLQTPILGVVTGREADVLDLGGGRRISPYVLTTALEKVGGLRRYQVRQTGRAALEVRAMLQPGASPPSAEEHIRGMLGRTIEGPLEVTVQFVSALPKGARAKFRVVEPFAHREHAGAITSDRES